MSSEQATIEELEQKIAQLTKENRSLKAQLQIEIEKESLHQLTLAKIKQIHSEYESSYLSSLSDYKSREANLKNQYFQYQSMLENQYNQNEKRLNDQIEQMKNVIKSKDQTISQIIKQNKELKQIISKNEIEWHLKENEYENAIKIKERKIKELEDSIKTITKEAGEEFQKLSTQLDDFQNKIRNGALVENEEYGDDIVNYLEGLYHLFIFDKFHSVLEVYQDFFTSKEYLYYCNNQNTWYISSHLQTLLKRK